MNSSQLREVFFTFFRSKQHHIVPSAPMVIKNDPTLMFTNAGMNQFKDIFLGNSPVKHSRIANTQKCLRVSGKHNDLEEVGHDTFHHTMFEMLGNWSFGDYFKREAIHWAMEFLVETLQIPKNRLYATVFEGNPEENLERDEEAYTFWKEVIEEDRILTGSKKDNFWEMGDTGPCGPCSEIHVDMRADGERKKVSGRALINKDHPLVIEIWNLVFIQYNRKADGKLEPLPNKHIDTGMGFERLCMVVQKKQSNYDTDIFQPLIQHISKLTALEYGKNEESDTAMRVVADHLRAIAFSIADGQIPSNTKAGYVIRRILRRAVRYGYTFLQQTEPFIHKLVATLANNMWDAFPELKEQQSLIERVIHEEEVGFLKTLDTGIRLLDQIIQESKTSKRKTIDGKIAFELYDTYGFPLDLTELILKENDLSVNRNEFEQEMKNQKERSRNAAAVETDDWITIRDEKAGEFIGYQKPEADVRIIRYRKVKSKGKEFYQLVFNCTPFYAESGGQIGDRGYIESGGKRYPVTDTIKENELTIHIAPGLPDKRDEQFHAVVDLERRNRIANNHTATHLLHHALRNVLGSHVEQKGSLVTPDHLRFDFSHFQKVTDDEIMKIESMVNELIRANLRREEQVNISMVEAKKSGAIALFGEKYGDRVRTIKFGDSMELCGGIHVEATGQIGFFKIISESAIAAGIRRIEAITAQKTEQYITEQNNLLKEIRRLIKGSDDLIQDVRNLVKQNNLLNKRVEAIEKEDLKLLRKNLVSKIIRINDMNVIAEEIEIHSVEGIKDLAFQLKKEVNDLFLILGAELNGKANLAIMIADNLVKEKNLNASNMIKAIAIEIKGGGGGQPFFATAGGQDPSGIQRAITQAKDIISKV